MRKILSLIASFLLCGMAWGQDCPPSTGKEQPRGKVVVYPTAEEAHRAAASGNKYVRNVGEWTREGSTLTAEFYVPFSWINRQVLLRIDWVSGDYRVKVNGREVGYNANSSAAAEFNVTKKVNEGRNTLEVELVREPGVEKMESWREEDLLLAGKARVMSQPTLRIRDVLVDSWRGNDEDTTVMAEVAVVVKTEALNPRKSRFHYELLSPKGERRAGGYRDITLDMRREDTVRFLANVPVGELWDTDSMFMHTLLLKTQHDGRYEEYIEQPVGFRMIEHHDGVVKVNDREVELRATEVRPDITAEEVAALRQQGYNTLQLLPGTVDDALYTACDSLGVYVIVQAPVNTLKSGEERTLGGNLSNNPAWAAAFEERVMESYHAAKRHPSVISFSIAQKSSNGINLYESYLKMKALKERRPVIYRDAAGEWNSDKLNLK